MSTTSVTGLTFDNESSSENVDSFYGRIFEPDVINKYYGGQSVPGAYNMFVSLSQKTMEQLGGRLQGLTEAIQNEDFDQALHYAHQLKGSFLMAGSPRLGTLCARLEVLCQKQELLGLQKNLDDLITLSEVFRSELAHFVSGSNHLENKWGSRVG
jgi:HPt (histidine-containing phosphotransfer) domain-containing protein